MPGSQAYASAANKDRLYSGTERAVRLLTNDDVSRVTEDINEAFRILRSTYGNVGVFYPRMPAALQKTFDIALETAFARLGSQEQRRRFIQRIERAGLPVIHDVTSRHILEELENINPTYQWRWADKMPPQRLVPLLSHNQLLRFQAMTMQLNRWGIEATTNMFLCGTLEPDHPHVATGGVIIVVPKGAGINGIAGQSLSFEKVEIMPFVVGKSISSPRDPGPRRRREVRIDENDRIVRGYRKLP